MDWTTMTMMWYPIYPTLFKSQKPSSRGAKLVVISMRGAKLAKLA
jgi:hypothetical protein